MRSGLGRLTFGHVWDGCAGPAHLEALALIARQCVANKKELVAKLPHDLRTDMQDDNDSLQVRELVACSSVKLSGHIQNPQT